MIAGLPYTALRDAIFTTPPPAQEVQMTPDQMVKAQELAPGVHVENDGSGQVTVHMPPHNPDIH